MAIFDLRVFKAMSSPTRIRIIRRLNSMRMTLSDLSSSFGMHPSTIKGHLDLLTDAGLIRLEDDGRKWKYYSVTSTGASILAGGEIRVSLPAISGLALLLISASGWRPAGTGAPPAPPVPASSEAVSSAISKAAQSGASNIESAVSSPAPPEFVSSAVSNAGEFGASNIGSAVSKVAESAASNVVGHNISSSVPAVAEPNATLSNLTPNTSALSGTFDASKPVEQAAVHFSFPVLFAVVGLLLILVSVYFWRKNRRNLLKNPA